MSCDGDNEKIVEQTQAQILINDTSNQEYNAESDKCKKKSVDTKLD